MADAKSQAFTLFGCEFPQVDRDVLQDLLILLVRWESRKRAVVFLHMRLDLSPRPRANQLLHLLVVFSVELNSGDKTVVLLSAPKANVVFPFLVALLSLTFDSRKQLLFLLD